MSRALRTQSMKLTSSSKGNKTNEPNSGTQTKDHLDLNQFYNELDERSELSEMVSDNSKQRLKKAPTMGERKKSNNVLADIDERDDDDKESLTYTNDTMSMGASINFGLTKMNLAENLEDLATMT